MYIFKSIIRSVLNNKLNNLIKILGIAISILVIIFVLIYIKHETSYDNHIPGAGNIYRVIRSWQKSDVYSPSTPVPLLQELIANFPEIETGTRLFPQHDKIIKYNEKIYHEDRIYGVDSSFLQTFNLQLISGNEKSALNNPGSVLISKSKSRLYFGIEDPVGKRLEFEGYNFNDKNKIFTITGVFEDYPDNSHFIPDFLLTLKSFDKFNDLIHTTHSIGTYIKLKEGTDKYKLEKKLPDFIRSFYGNEYYEYANSTYLLESITDIHLNTFVYDYGYETEKGDSKTIFIYPLLAILVILIAGINYFNLTIAEGYKKIKNFGVNKITGANKLFFIKNYLTESGFLIGIGLIFTSIAIYISLPHFGAIMGRILNIDVIKNWKSIIIIFVAILFLFIMGAFIPAFVFSRKKTINLINRKNNLKAGTPINQVFQTIQFTICIFLLISSFFIYKQLIFINNKTNSSMKTENIFVIYNVRYLNQREAFKQELLNLASIKNASFCNEIPGNGDCSTWGGPIDSALKAVHVTVFECDKDYASTLNFGIVKGRFFESKLNDKNSIVLNENVVKELGWEDNPLGKRYWLGKEYNVIGVAKDIHFESLQYPMSPQAFIPNRNETSASKLIAKLNSANVNEVIKNIKAIWRKFVPDRDMYYGFLDQEYEKWYKTERKTFKLSIMLTVIAIFLSGLGLLAAVLNKVEVKTKEIGIRKVNGAKIREIVAMLNKDFVIWITVAFITACPIAWYAMNKWLQNFAYKTELSWWVFVAAGAVAVAVALITVSWQSFRAATRNPVDALRYE